MYKSILILCISVLDSTMTIDSHNYHFMLDYFVQCTKCLSTSQEYKEYSDLFLNVIDGLI